MQSAILVLHLMVALALIGVVLLQRSEGGALGIGGGGGGGGGFGGLMSGRGAAGGLVKVSVILGAMFFATSIGLSVLGNFGGGSVLDSISVEQSGPASDSGIRLGDEAAGDASGEPAAETPPAPDGPAVPLSQ